MNLIASFLVGLVTSLLLSLGFLRAASCRAGDCLGGDFVAPLDGATGATAPMSLPCNFTHADA